MQPAVIPLKGYAMQTAPTLNRRGEIRHDSLQIDQLFVKTTSKILLSYKGRFLCKDHKAHYFSFEQLKALDGHIESSLSNNDHPLQKIYLGEYQQIHYFVLQMVELYPALAEMQLLDLRTASLSAELFDIGSLFYSQGLINWHFDHAFCAKCGAKSEPVQSGHSRKCTNEHCAREHFPRIEPAVIFSIVTSMDGIEKLLLARQANWPEKRYSVIAGFAEHGESLELAVAREAMEEVGLEVSKVRYISSQPWPFPASLMLGFTSETKQHDIRLVDQELEHAQWFSAEEMKAAIESGELLMPFSVSISWHLVDRWYQSQTGNSLKSINKNE